MPLLTRGYRTAGRRTLASISPAVSLVAALLLRRLKDELHATILRFRGNGSGIRYRQGSAAGFDLEIRTRDTKGGDVVGQGLSAAEGEFVGIRPRVRMPLDGEDRIGVRGQGLREGVDFGFDLQ